MKMQRKKTNMPPTTVTLIPGATTPLSTANVDITTLHEIAATEPKLPRATALFAPRWNMLLQLQALAVVTQEIVGAARES